ncbi:hypothetical protein GYMLUDRAFT_475341 [Collybiopsis luxurians FD-317 M1]|uniref:Uncharacterized protein n=1 Tax=Collybiopsis luxurians FD-317 M1 TaxID=944289 RepID=A0A0D0BGM3_9AGAR|nr:hypothetical protein GYMLUDRAFT_475341 [Collybiopsis luxurians FD-317 M1]
MKHIFSLYLFLPHAAMLLELYVMLYAKSRIITEPPHILIVLSWTEALTCASR